MRGNLALICGWAATLACGDAGGTKSDSPISSVTCTDCRVVAESIAYLGHPDDTVAFREDVLPARDSRGRFYAVDRRGTIVYVFGTDGRLMSSFGKAGRGPGEFIGLRAIFVGTGDTLYIPGGAAIHVVSPAYAHVREVRNMGGSIDEFSATMLADGRILNGRSDHQFSLIDSTGAVSARVKLAGVDERPCGECSERIYRESRAHGTLWSGPLAPYVIEEHDVTGKFIRRITREAKWFRDWTAEDIAARTVVAELGRPRMFGVRQSSDGTLYTHVSLIENPDDLRGIDEDVPAQMSHLWQRVRTHVEAIDPERRELLGEVILEGLVVPLTGDYSAQLVVDEGGGWEWKILRFRVDGRHK